VIHWADLEHERLLLPRQGPGPEFLELFVGEIGCSKSCRIRRHDVALDRLLTLVGAGWGILVALEGATGVNYSGVTFRDIAYARQCRAFGLTLPSLRDKDKMWRETLLGAIGWLSGTGLKFAISARCLNAESPSTIGIPPARKILLRVNQPPVDATMSWRGEVLFRRIEDAFGESAPNYKSEHMDMLYCLVGSDAASAFPSRPFWPYFTSGRCRAGGRSIPRHIRRSHRASE
jgi:hypothetical protein